MDESKNVGTMTHISNVLLKYQDPAFLREEKLANLDDEIDSDFKKVEQAEYLESISRDPSQISQTQFNW